MMFGIISDSIAMLALISAGVIAAMKLRDRGSHAAAVLAAVASVFFASSSAFSLLSALLGLYVQPVYMSVIKAAFGTLLLACDAAAAVRMLRT